MSVPPAYVLYCDQLAGRRKITEAHLAERGVAASFWRGVHGDTWGLRTVHPYEVDRPGSGYLVGPHTIGCTLSHWHLWQHVWQAGHEQALIMEDDVILCEDFPARLDAAMAQVPDDWQLVYAGVIGEEWKVRQRVSPGVVEMHHPFGTHCYLVRRSALPVLLDTMQLAWAPIDIQLIFRSLPRLRHYVLWPTLARQRSAEGEWSRTC